jgi:hypothetical protein
MRINTDRWQHGRIRHQSSDGTVATSLFGHLLLVPLRAPVPSWVRPSVGEGPWGANTVAHRAKDGELQGRGMIVDGRGVKLQGC